MVKDKRDEDENSVAPWGSGPTPVPKLDLPDLSTLGEGNVEYFWRVEKRKSPHDTHVALASISPFDIYLMRRTSSTVAGVGWFRKPVPTTKVTEDVILQTSISGFGKYPTEWKEEVEKQARRIFATFKAQTDIVGDY